MAWSHRLILAVKKAMGVEAPQPGRLLFPRKEDAVRDYVTSGLTPSGLMTLLREADGGSLGAAMQLFEEMEEKDPHLYSVATTRRLAVTGLDWGIVSAADVDDGVDRAAADDAAAYCREAARKLDRWDEMLSHLSLAIGRNVAVGELVWDVDDGELSLVDLVPVDFGRLVLDETDQLRILLKSTDMEGILPPPNKFVVHMPHAPSGHPSRGGLLRVTAMAYLAKNLALKDWMIFAELFGMPVRLAQYEPSASAEEKKEMLSMLESLGSHAAGIFSKAVDLKLLEANRGSSGPPFGAMIDFLNREMSKAWLGQTLSTDTTGASSSFAAATVHERVRQDLRAEDLRQEGRTLRRDLLGPMARLRFGADVPVPYFRRRQEMPRDTEQVVAVLDAAVNKLGLTVSEAWIHRTLGIPMAGSHAKSRDEQAK